MLCTTFIKPKSICLFISIPYPNQVYDKQKKTFLSGDLCDVYCHALEYFFSRMAFSSVLQVVTKKKLSLTMVGTFGKHLSNFPILRKRHQF